MVMAMEESQIFGALVALYLKWPPLNLLGMYTVGTSSKSHDSYLLYRADYPPEAAMFQIGMGKPIPPLPDHLPKTLTNFFYLCLTR